MRKDGSFATRARIFPRAGACLAICLLVVGCNETTGSIKEPLRVQTTAPARNPDVSPRPASVALNLTGIDNVPPAIVSRFSAALVSAANARQVDFVEAKAAKYYVQMHLTAFNSPGGTAFAYVSDVFDARKNRAQRLSDAIIVKESADDPWSVVDDKALEAVAARSADDLAAFLSNTPEAIAAADAPARHPALSRSIAPPAPSAGMPAGALGFSAVR
ncbi:MAG: hypothetical protein NVSMB26_23790 [Beijerinckiaceae bacterium]